MAIEKRIGAYSAYAIAVENGFQGTVKEWLESLIGPRGYQGWGVSAVSVSADGSLIFTIKNPETGETRELEPIQIETLNALNSISTAKDEAVNEVKKAQTQAVQAVEDAENTGVSAVEDAKSNALTEVGKAKTTAVAAVNAAGTQAASDAQTAITTAKNQAVSDVQTVEQAAVSSVGDAQTEAVEAVETAQTNAVQSVQDTGAAEVEKINDILPVPTAEDAGKVPIAKPDGSGYELGSQIDDAKTSLDTTWSSESIVSRICPPFELSGSIVTCNPVEGSTLNTVVQIEPVQEGEGDPSPENVRPIRGWDTVNVWRGGKNLLGENLPALDGYISGIDKTIIADIRQGKTYVIPIKKHGTFTASVNRTQIIRLATCAVKPYLGVNLSTVTTTTYTSQSITTNSSDRYLVVNLPSVDFETDEPMLVFQEETSYQSYRGKTFTISLGQTVYGGTLDVGSGVLTIIDKLSDLPEIPESANNSILEFTNVVRFNLRLKLIFTDANSDTYPGISSHFPYNVNYSQDTPHWYIGSSSLLLFINKSELGSYDISGLNAWVSKYSPVQFVYRLANPVTVQLTPQEILALSGENTVYADAGNITVSGYSDPNAIIKNLSDRIAALEHNAIGG